MDYRLLGDSGLNVSKYALGTIPFSGTKGFEAAGDMDQSTADALVDYALEHGINHFDTANLYAKGDAEIVLGKAIRDKRKDMVIASKTGFQLTDNPNDVGATRINIEASIDETLNRLGTDYLDLYYVHVWDGQVSVEETVLAMNDLIRRGKIRYWGVSNYSGWALAKTHTFAVENNLMPPIAHQVYYTPESREAEYELLPAAKELGIGNTIWSPLGEGLLTGKISRDRKAEPGTRQGEGWGEPYVKDEKLFFDLVEMLQDVASDHNATVPQVVLAWLRDRPNVDSVILGTRNKAQLEENIASYDLQLTDNQIVQINDLTQPEPIYPLWHRAMNAMDRASDAEKTYLEAYNKLMNQKDKDL
ncbi:aldo/keto reductase [Salinicoccus siamensis]|uniref:Aldo/keto reductase n=1 Tax=Salinicoccus siamensis TaxID=381830 RepID=A0ABV5Z307_9STAP